MQSEFSKITTGEAFQPQASTSTVEGSTRSADASQSIDEKAGTGTSAAVTTGEDKEAGAESGPASGSTSTPTSGGEPGSPSPASSPLPSTGSSLFSRLQSALPPNIVAAVQTNLQQTSETLAHTTESLRAAAEGLDLAKLRSELSRVQGVTLAQAEEYAHRSEALLREAVREAGEVLRDAVKVLPPEEDSSGGGGAHGMPLLWDGADIWMLPAEGAGEQPRRMSESSARGGGAETQSAVATRAEALLRRLKRDPDIVRHDPGVEEGVKEHYLSWKETEMDTLDGGVEGAEWKTRVEAMREEAVDGDALKQLEQTLGVFLYSGIRVLTADLFNSIIVPSEMTAASFWLRIFFRTYQIRSEEEKRKALIQSESLHHSRSPPSYNSLGTADDVDEDFSWEDEDDDVSPSGKQVKSTQATTSAEKPSDKPTAQTLNVPATSTPGSNTPRVSSEDSFDLVSSTSPTGEEKAATKPKKASTEEEDGDSDWE